MSGRRLRVKFKPGYIMIRKFPLAIELLKQSEHLFDAMNRERTLPASCWRAHLEQSLASLLTAFFIEGSNTVKAIRGWKRLGYRSEPR